MLPLINNALPSSPLPSSNSTAGASLLAATSTDSSSASRQQLATAVTATPSTASYFAGTAQQTDAADRNIPRIYVPPPTDNYISLPEDVAAQQALQQAQTQQVQPQQRSGPVTLGIPLTSQLNAQFIAQQPLPGTTAAQQSQSESTDSSSDDTQPQATTTTRTRQPHFSSAKGATAYHFAVARSAAINSKPEVEAA